MIDPPVWQTRISPGIFLKIQHVYGEKMIDPLVWQTRISPGIFLKIQMHMVKRWLTPPEWQTRISPRIFLKIHYVYGQKIGSQQEMILKDSSAHGQKMIDWPPRDDKPGSHLRIFLKIQHVYGQKMIDPLVWQTRISPGIFLKIQCAHGQKMIDPPRMTDQDLT